MLGNLDTMFCADLYYYINTMIHNDQLYTMAKQNLWLAIYVGSIFYT